ncbi:MAG: 50S ribosomal protein L29 [Desulfobulbaceae bacterium]|jgi:large subunit ribosomal protein L29|nr:50S ribosomal protein L29 [Desulfobulbaceae bacterium]
MKVKELRKKLREMSEDELMAKERDLREDYFKLKFQHGVGQLENTGRLNQVRKDISRVMTAKNAKKSA